MSYRQDHLRMESRKALGMLSGSDDGIFANLSRRHPDHGMTPQEHAVSKTLREAHLGPSRKGMPRRVYKTDLLAYLKAAS